MDVNYLNGYTTIETRRERERERERIDILLFGFHYLYTNPCCENTHL